MGRKDHADTRRGQAPGARHVRRVQRAVFRWFAIHERDLPWRRTHDPYRILVSEVMLQQTPVDRVVPKYCAFLRRFPTVRALAAATPRDVLLAWAGLGYNRRALYLHRMAHQVVGRFGGRVPADLASLQTLPGVGDYTAAAVATFATGKPHAMADTNIQRVVGRVFFRAGRPSARGPRARSGGTKRSYGATRGLLRARMRAREDREKGDTVALLKRVEQTMPRLPVLGFPPALWGHALMDFGALVCRAKPKCERCPLQRLCRSSADLLQGERSEVGSRGSERWRGETVRPQTSDLRPPCPDRLIRGRILQLVRGADPRPVSLPRLQRAIPERSLPALALLVRKLRAEGLLGEAGGGRFCLPS